MTWRDLHIKNSSSKQVSTLGLQVGEVFFITGDFGALESHEMSGLIFQNRSAPHKLQYCWLLGGYGRIFVRIDVFGIFRDFQGFSPQEIRRLSSSCPTPEAKKNAKITALKLKPAKRCHPPPKKTSFQPLPRSYGLWMAMMGYALFFVEGKDFRKKT